MGKLNTAVIERPKIAAETVEDSKPGDGIDEALDVAKAESEAESFADESLAWEDTDDEEDWGTTDQSETVESAAETEEVVESKPEEQPEPEIVWDEEAEHRKDEAEFHLRLKELNDSVRRKQAYLNDAKEELKVAKAELLCAQTDLLDFVSDGVQYREKPKPKPKKVETKPAVSETNGPVSESTASNPETKLTENESTDWRSIPTAKIVEGIEGLGKKKLEALLDDFPTLGKLEDARGEASKEFAPFKSKLPKGFGDELTSRIENKMLEAIK